MKRILLLAALFAALGAEAQLPAEIRLDKRSLRPRYREWAQPAGGTAVTLNPPALLWPAAGDSKRAVYRVRLSQDSTFAGVTPSEPFEWAAYACHEPLAEGRWYWQWSVTEPGGAERWSAVNAFTVDASCRRFATPTGEELVRRGAAMPHHRLFVSRDGADAFRTRAQRNPEAQELVRKARRNLNMDLVPVAPTRPRDTTGMTPFQKKSLVNFMYHKFGEVVTQPVVDFSMAYLLTGEEPFRDAAVRHALHAASLPVDSDATSEDFNRSAIMYGLAVGYDTACDRMTPRRAGRGARSHPCPGGAFLQTLRQRISRPTRWTTTSGSTPSATSSSRPSPRWATCPEAEKWFRYCYEIWCARFPILGGDAAARRQQATCRPIS